MMYTFTRKFIPINLFLILLSPLIADPQDIAPAPAYQVIDSVTTLPILTPALAERCTEKLILANGMRVYLISDPGADQSAAGVAVEAGSWADPVEYPGTAHFLEHMLFMGTKAYPNESEYMSFIHEHAGTVNAFTAPDRTVYMLSINNESFEEAIDRFSHFFIDPLLSTQCINRELHAVDQEHAKNIEHDGWRQLMIFKESGNPHHPNSKFSTGNAQTLSGIPQTALRQWYESHYSADRMHLVMLSPLPIAEMRTLAVTHFSAVPQVTTPDSTISTPMASAQQKGHMIFIQPVKEIKQLSLTWEVSAPFASDIDRKAPELVAYALNHQDKNGLSQLLKEEKIAESISVSCDRFSKNSQLFSIDINLTEEGLTKIDTTISRVFEALARLKQEGYPSHLFDEVQTMAKLNYQFQSRDDAFSTIQHIASEMPNEPLASYPEKTTIPSQYDPAFINNFLNTLTAQECIYFVIASPAKTKITPDKKEKWMQAEYSIKPVSKARMSAWNALTPNPLMLLPPANPYLPAQLALVQDEQSSLFFKPTLIDSDAGCQIYYAADERYKVPEVALLFAFQSPLLQNTAKSRVLCDLYTKAFTEALASPLSLAGNAGLQCSLYPKDAALKLSVMGYNDKAPLLLEELFSQFGHIQISKEKFNIYKTTLTTAYDNASKELPIRQAMQQLDGILFQNPSSQDKLNAIASISYEDFTQFSTQLFNTLYTQALLYGNLSHSQAKALWDTLKTTLRAAPFPRKEHVQRKIFVLNENRDPYQILETTSRQGSGALLLLQEGPFSFSNRASQQILGTALSDSFFDTLRTKQQTGYIAKAWNVEEERQLLQFFAVQSSTHSCQNLLVRFEIFLEEFSKNLRTHIPEGRFESLRSNLITLSKMPPENMAGMAQQLNLFAFEYADFQWLDKRVQALQSLSYEDFCKGAQEYLSHNNTKRIAVLMQGSLSPEKKMQYQITTKEDISSFGSFLPGTLGSSKQ